MSRVVVVGAGISGAACAAALRSAGVEVTVRERGRAPGGRLASPELHSRRVDLGAAYFTVADPRFAAVVANWQRRGLVREWTDTFAVVDDEGRRTTTGPMRWAAPGGLRSLARDLHGDLELDLELDTEVTELPHGFDATVLAMPDPQAARLAPTLTRWIEYEPVIAVALGCAERSWSFDAMFVNDNAEVALIADDGARRGDGAPVLVAHTTADRARRHLDDPAASTAPVLDAVRSLIGLPEPQWTHTHRWTFAKPNGTHGEMPYLLDGSVGVCGDSWCPEGSPRVEAAWLSGHRLGVELARRLHSRT